jgi:predicted PurR-regulated permease PerM
VVLVVTIGAGALFGMVGLTLAAPLTLAAVHIANELGPGAATRRSAGRRPRPASSVPAAPPG